TDREVEAVAAYYDANAHHVTIIDRGEDEDQAQDVGTLAHELVHAAQDRDVGFGRLYQDVVSRDNALAMSALLEGEAVLYQYLIDAKQRDIPKTLIDWRILDGWTLDVRARVFEKASPYPLATAELLYPLGGAYVASAYKSGGPLEVRGMFDPPPLSASRFIATRGALDDVAPPPWSCGLIDPPPQHEIVLSDELGALALYSFATRFALAEPAAWERTRSWTGDRFYVYRNPDDAQALAVVWIVRCTDNQAAIALNNMLQAVAWPSPLESVVSGDRLHLFATRTPMDTPYGGFTQCNPL
ncbi:MAG TPA: hypothetical protein VMF89_00235, partial [Polyangiales bacterium]|nr:hypothetical protein [Polyangiales bacterium]